MTGPLEALAAITERGWLVGGALRDRLLGRETADYDVVIPVGTDEVRRLARALGRATTCIRICCLHTRPLAGALHFSARTRGADCSSSR